MKDSFSLHRSEVDLSAAFRRPFSKAWSLPACSGTKALGFPWMAVGGPGGLGAWMDNVFIERLWWPLKYECIYINEFEDGKTLRKGLGAWIDFYNTRRGHSSLNNRTPIKPLNCPAIADHRSD